MYTKEEEAIRLVVKAFEGMKRQKEDINLSIHSILVGNLLKNNGCSSDIVISGYLHDIIEDTNYDYDYLVELTNGVINNQKELDFMISMNLKNYTLDRLSVVDRSLLELGAYELLFTTTPTNIVINEIVEISKEYSELDDYKSSKFNNAVLDAIAKSRK